MEKPFSPCRYFFIPYYPLSREMSYPSRQNNMEKGDHSLNVKDVLSQANSFYRSGQLNEALSRYDYASILQPANPHIWTAKGRVLADLHRYRDAASAFSRSLSLIEKGKYKIYIPEYETSETPEKRRGPISLEEEKQGKVEPAGQKVSREEIPIPADIYSEVELPEHVSRTIDELEKYLEQEAEKEEKPGVQVHPELKPQMEKRKVSVPPALKKKRVGFINGYSRRVSPGKSRTRVKKMRVVTGVIIAITVVISGSVLWIMYPIGRGIVIDGNFEDWQNIPHIDMSSNSTRDPSIDIISIGYSLGDTTLSIHIIVRGRVFSGEPSGEPGRGDTLHIFLDTDGDRNTGYDMNGFGADMLIRVFGRFGEVRSSQLFVYGTPLDRNNFSAFTPQAGIPARASGSEVELQVSSLGFAPGFGIYAGMKSYAGEEDFLDYPVGVGVPSLEVIPDVPPGGSYPAEENVSLLSITLRPHTTVHDLQIKIHTTLPELKALGREIITSGGISTLNLGTVDRETRVDVSGDLKTLGKGGVAGAWLESAEDIIGDALVSFSAEGMRDARKYVISPPDDVHIDGAFGEWKELKEDPVDQEYRNIDIRRYNALRNGSGILFYLDVEGEVFGGVVVPFSAPIIISTPPKPGNGSGVPPGLPRADGADNAYIFLDVDRDPSTGYSVGEIGAEYAVIITGKYGKVFSRGLYHYGRAWNRVSDVSILRDSSQFEGAVSVPGLNNSVKVVFMVERWDKQERDLTETEITAMRSMPHTRRGSREERVTDLPEPEAIERYDFVIGEQRFYSGYTLITNTYYRAQSIVAPFDFMLTRTRVVVCDNGSAADTLTMEIRTDSGGLPSSTVALSYTPSLPAPRDCRNPPAGYIYAVADWNSLIEIKGGTRIWLVLKSSATTTDEAIYWLRSTSADLFPNGYYAYSNDGGSSWTSISTYDGLFTMHGTEIMSFEDSAESSVKGSRYVLGDGVTIGTGTSSQNAPLDAYYNYHRSQMIYLASEVGSGGLITAIKFNSYIMNEDNIQSLQVWLGETPQSSYSSDTWISPEGTLVYSGSFTVPMYGYGSSQSVRWMEIPLQTPFVYSGTQNLLVSIYTQTSREDGYSLYYYTSTGSYMFVSGSDDSTNPPPVTRSYSRPNIQIVWGAWQRGVPANVGPPGDHTRGGNTLSWGTIINGNYPNSITATLTTNYIYLPSGTTPVLSFWHYYDTESSVDGGRVLYSIDISSGFSPLNPVGGYPSTCSSLGGSGCFSGASAGWRRVVFDLSLYAGNTIRFRFQFASDSGGPGLPGWYIDDIKVGYPIQIDEVWSYGTGAGEKIVLYNYGPSDISVAGWRIARTSGETIILSGTVPSGGTWSYSISLNDAGDYVRIKDSTTRGSISESGYASSTRVDVDYMQYGTTTGVVSQLWGLIWTQGSALPAPSSSSQYLKRDSEGSFTSVDTGDAGDWVIVPEWTAPWILMCISVPPVVIFIRRKKPGSIRF